MQVERRCWGLARNLRRCDRRGPWRWFCRDHSKQPWVWLFVALFTVGPALVTYRALLGHQENPRAVLELAQKHAVTEAALERFFREMNEVQVPAAELDQRLQTFVQEYRRLQKEIEALGGRGEDVRRIQGEARDALESGDLETAARFLEVVREARAHGEYGLRVNFPGKVQYVEKSRYTRGIIQYSARFFVRADALRLPESVDLPVFGGWSAAGKRQFYLTLRRGADGLEIFPEAFDAAGQRRAGRPLPLAAGWRCVEMFWRAGDPQGELRLQVDGGVRRGLAGFENLGATIDAVRLGAPVTVDPAIRGYLDLDSFASTQGTPIGCDANR